MLQTGKHMVEIPVRISIKPYVTPMVSSGQP